jgi:CRISPR-associated protein Cas1
MGYRNIVVENPCKLRYSKGQLCILSELDYTIPIEDISTIILESQGITVTNKLLAECSVQRVPIYICDEKHLPAGIVLPFASYSREYKNLKMQMFLPKVLKNQIWKKIVKGKIENQARCLDIVGKERHNLWKIADEVKSNDRDHREGYAAKIYFSKLYGNNFLRFNDDIENHALNYGYSIIRGYIARTLCFYGLHPAIGIFHESELNNFNLADDLIEPFRPIVDLWVAENIKYYDSFDKDLKNELIRLLYHVMKIRGQKQSVRRTIEQFVCSLSTSYIKKDAEELILPELQHLELQRYED